LRVAQGWLAIDGRAPSKKENKAQGESGKEKWRAAQCVDAQKALRI